MPTIHQEKRANEIVQLGADFTAVLPSGDSIILGNASVLVIDALSDILAPSIFVGGSLALNGNTLTGAFQGGTNGTTYRVTFRTGTTAGGNSYEAELHLIVTSSPAAENLLCTREGIKRAGKITDNSDDAFFDSIALFVSGYIRGRTNRDFDLRRYTERIFLQCEEDRTSIQVEHWPLLRVESVELREAYDAGATIYIAGIEFSDDGEVWFTDGTSFLQEPSSNHIVYRAGYTKIPDDLRGDAEALGAWVYKTADSTGFSVERIGDYMYQRASLRDLPAHIKGDIPDARIEGTLARYAREQIR